VAAKAGDARRGNSVVGPAHRARLARVRQPTATVPSLAMPPVANGHRGQGGVVSGRHLKAGRRLAPRVQQGRERNPWPGLFCWSSSGRRSGWESTLPSATGQRTESRARRLVGFSVHCCYGSCSSPCTWPNAGGPRRRTPSAQACRPRTRHGFRPPPPHPSPHPQSRQDSSGAARIAPRTFAPRHGSAVTAAGPKPRSELRAVARRSAGELPPRDTNLLEPGCRMSRRGTGAPAKHRSCLGRTGSVPAKLKSGLRWHASSMRLNPGESVGQDDPHAFGVAERVFPGSLPEQ
jgi:hypothetical protein